MGILSLVKNDWMQLGGLYYVLTHRIITDISEYKTVKKNIKTIMLFKALPVLQIGYGKKETQVQRRLWKAFKHF